MKKFGINIGEAYEKMQLNVPVYLLTCIVSLVIMGLVALAVFFMNVRGEEKVLVPNITGKPLEEAMLELQAKELYAKINLRYSDVPDDEGTVLSQSPAPGAIVKGYSRVSLVVSRGIIVDKIDNYIGMNVDELRAKLQTLFAGQSRQLIVLGNPEYIPNQADAGTILEQDPPEGTQISEPVTMHLVVSRGPTYENTRVPDLTGQGVNDVLQAISRNKLVFDFTSRAPDEAEAPGTVVSQQRFSSEYVANYTHVSVELALPEDEFNGNVYGIFRETLTDYLFPVSMRLEAIPPEGNSYVMVTFTHPGGRLTVPYAVPSGTQLVLSVADKVVARQTVN